MQLTSLNLRFMLMFDLPVELGLGMASQKNNSNDSNTLKFLLSEGALIIYKCINA
jgi:CRISPR/Cas system-associated protein endoribonuclease Cas2